MAVISERDKDYSVTAAAAAALETRAMIGDEQSL